jgi:Mn2+/Fe2+ NRAMP family transporter
MGEHVNTRTFNVIAWITVTVMIALTLAMIVAR